MNGDCEHKNFKSEVKVYRLTEVENGPVTGYTADIEIVCAECHMPFVFVGVPQGVSPAHPTSNIDGNELRAPIKPLMS